ncbi:MAG: uncharacterized protein PWR32_454 [Candidatus Woesearchaeota archaeon]|nr:uncharacterized protein [Candidatus Woesearchaeota archaeon]
MHSYYFQDLKFSLNNNKLRVFLYKIFYREFEISSEFKEKFSVKDGAIFSENKQELNALINEILFQINDYVINSITKKKTKYINKNSEIPLIGHSAFGIVDRNTNWIEVKPITGCNLDCIFCSVDENKRAYDFVVEVDYLVEEIFKLADLKKNKVTIVINAHGEPMLYAKLPELISKLKQNNKVEKVILITNGTLLDIERIKELESANLDQVNISLNSIDTEKGKFLSNNQSYDSKKIINSILYLKKKTKINVVIAPVYLHKINEDQIEQIVKFGKENDIPVAIQNFLEYKTGKRPTKQISFEKFYNKLKEWESKYETNLTKFDFDIKKDKVLDLPFHKNQVIDVELRSFGRFGNEMLGVVPGINRVVSVLNSNKKIGEKQKVKLIRVKHNIFVGEAI